MFSSTIKLLLYRYLLKVHPQVARVDLPPECVKQNNTFSVFFSWLTACWFKWELRISKCLCSVHFFCLRCLELVLSSCQGVFALSMCCIPLLPVGSSPATCRFFGRSKHFLVPGKIIVLVKSCWELWKSLVHIQNMWDGDILFQASRWILSTLLSLEDSTILFTYQTWFSRLQRSEN